MLDQDTGLVRIEDVLGQGSNVLFDDFLVLRQRVADRLVPDHLTHGALGSSLGRFLGVLDIEEELSGILDHPKHGEIDVDDVFIAGQHQAFFRHVPRRLSAAKITGTAITDLDLIDPCDFGRLDGLDGGGQVIVEAGLCRRHPFAKAQHDTLFIRLHAVKATGGPNGNGDQDYQRQAASASPSTGEYASKSILSLA